jgi:hypothetical protein
VSNVLYCRGGSSLQLQLSPIINTNKQGGTKLFLFRSTETGHYSWTKHLLFYDIVDLKKGEAVVNPRE